MSENTQNNDISRMSLIVKVRSVSPERQIPIKELGLDASELPKEVKSFLKEDVIPSEELKPFGRMRRKFELDMAQFAIKNEEDKLWVFHPDDAERACNLALKLEKEYNSAVAHLKNEYPRIKADVLKRVRNEFGSYPFVNKLEEAVERHQPSWEYIERRLQLYYSFRPVAQITSSNPKVFEVMKRGEQADKENLYGTLLRQIAEKSEKVLDRIYSGDDVSPRTIESVADMQYKVNRLSFLDSRLKPLAAGMKKVLDAIPKSKNRVPVSQLGEFTAMVTLLSNEQRLLKRLDENKPLIFQAAQAGNTVNISAAKRQKRDKSQEQTAASTPRVLKGSPRKKRQTGRLTGLSL